MHALRNVLALLWHIFMTYLELLYRLVCHKPAKNIQNKVVVVTGAGQGIGRCLSLQFAAVGAKLALLDINKESLLEVQDEIRSRGGIAHAYTCNVCKSEQVREVAASIEADLGKVYMLVNNAGVFTIKSLLDLDEAEIRRTYEVNTLAHYWMVKQFLPGMLADNDGHIVTIASAAAKFGTAYTTDYSGSKFAVNGFTEALAQEIRTVYRKPGVKTSTVYCTIVNTNLVRQHAARVRVETGVEGLLTPERVSRDIVGGVLRDECEIYIPAWLQVVDLFRALVAREVRDATLEAVGLGFFEK